MAKKLAFDRSLYLPEAIHAAASAYADYAAIEVAENGDSIETTISGVADDELEMVAHAFGNHVLYETITRLRHSEQ